MSEGPLQLDAVLQEEAAAIRPDGDRSRPMSALCISGGGIRSATFALGAIQSLAEYGLLEQFDYLSTVSGGGYIGAWLSAWATRANGIENIAERLCADAPPPATGEPDPVQHLREYNNYLSPKLGGFSADTWTLIATVVRNIALNWVVLIPLLLFFLMGPRLLMAIACLSENYALAHVTDPDKMAKSATVVYLLPIATSILFCFALFNIWRYLPGIGGHNHTGSDFMKRILAPLSVATMLFCAYDALHFWDASVGTLTFVECIEATLFPAALTWIAFLLVCVKSGKARLTLLWRHSLAIGLLAASLGTAEWWVTARLAPSPGINWAQYVTIVPPLIGVSFLAALAVFAGLSSRSLEDQDREWMSRASAGILLTCVGWAGACVLVLVVPHWVFTWKSWGGGAMTAVGVLAGWATSHSRRDGSVAKGTPAWVGVAIKLAPAVFIVALAIGLATLTNVFIQITHISRAPWWDHYRLLDTSAWDGVTAMAAVFSGTAWVAARFININKFSLHGMYRDRLTRAFLGASNPDRVVESKIVDGGPNRFTGFAQSDNLKMHQLIRRPFHVVNLTLNLVGGKRLAWQQRKAQSFTVTPLHCGNYCLGYRPSEPYGQGISLGTAITISGAAASPNMGYHSSPATGFLMTLLNARLGAWLGNPGAAGEKTWKLGGPKSAIGSLIKEAFGLTTNESEYVYLSDGGHFENLALYEMVLRRCRSIVLLDSGCDETFTYEDLGNALRKIRIDLKIPITFLDGGVLKEKRCAVARIDYAEVDGPCEPGFLVYVKPKMLGDEPPDVISYARANAAFPHQGTGDQWFDESQTESYRMLGMFTMDSICGNWDNDASIADFARHVRNEYLGHGRTIAAGS